MAEQRESSGAAPSTSAMNSNTGASQQSSLPANINAAQATTTERKIIQNAALTLETDKPADGGRRIAAIAEQSGGYVASTDTRQRGDE
ncbi:MAG: hypothetical protein H0V27_15500, partial [Pyrinomonadaceae bacterium]|nr:hypothetical protein [Pyrinomonadaceae bacterium]